MNLKLAKLIAFALEAEMYTGAMGCAPALLVERWQWYDGFVVLEDLWSDLPASVAAKLRNYELVWAKQLDGLTAAGPAAAPPEAENVPAEQSKKSESVIIGPQDVAKADELHGYYIEGSKNENGTAL